MMGLFFVSASFRAQSPRFHSTGAMMFYYDIVVTNEQIQCLIVVFFVLIILYFQLLSAFVTFSTANESKKT